MNKLKHPSKITISKILEYAKSNQIDLEGCGSLFVSVVKNDALNGYSKCKTDALDELQMVILRARHAAALSVLDVIDQCVKAGIEAGKNEYIRDMKNDIQKRIFDDLEKESANRRKRMWNAFNDDIEKAGNKQIKQITIKHIAIQLCVLAVFMFIDWLR